MGKRRKPARKPNYQSLEEINSSNLRMSGDELVKFMNEVPERELGPVYDGLMDKVAALNAIDNELMAAGVPASEFRGLQRLQVPELKGGVPAPYVDKSVPGIERRVHLTREDGELYPIANNNPQAGDYLVTEFGNKVNMEGENKATEYVQDHILRLMGYDPVRGPKGKVDFYIDHDGRRVGVDGQTSRTSWKPSVQAYAKVIPTQRERGGYGYGYSPQRSRGRSNMNTQANEIAIVNDIADSLRGEMDGKTGLKRAINNLIEKGLIEKDQWLRGKAYRADYDAVLMPVLEPRAHMANAARDLTSIAPEKVVSYKMSDAREAVDNIRNPERLNIVPNAGEKRRGELRGQISVELPRGVVKDVTVQHPFVQQILRKLPYA